MEQPEQKRKAGRPITTNSKDKEYFLKYYHEHNKLMVCECGLPIHSGSLYKHKKSKKHNFLLENNTLKKI